MSEEPVVSEQSPKPPYTETQQRNVRRGSDRLLEALDRLRRAEERKRSEPFGSDRFHRLAREVEQEARELFRLAERQEDFGDVGEPVSEDSPGWPVPPYPDEDAHGQGRRREGH